MLAIIRQELHHLGRSLGLNLLYMVGLLLAVTPFALWGPLALRIAAFIVIWLGGTAYAISKLPKDSINGWMVILAAAPTFMVATGLKDAVGVALGPHVRGISAAEAPAHPDAVAFTFDDAVVQTDHAYTYRSVSHNRKSGRVTYTYYSVAPVTPASWRPGEPVPAWAGCGETYEARCAEWTRPYRAGIMPEDFERAGLERAVALALAERGLTQVPGAPVLAWVETIDQGANQRALRILVVALLSYLIFAVPSTLQQLGRLVARLWDHFLRGGRTPDRGT